MKINVLGEKVEKYLLPIANKLTSQRYLKAIRDAFLTLLPINIAGGIVAVLAAAPVSEGTTNAFLLAWAQFAQDNGFILSWINSVTMGSLSLYLCIGITYYLARYYKDEPFLPTIISICGFMMLVVVPKELGWAGNLAEISYIGGKGIIPAILISLITMESYHFMKSKEFGKIKMPPSVPEVLSNTFANMVPCIVIILVDVIIFSIFNKMGTSLPDALYTILAPSFEATDSIFFVIIVSLLTHFLFFFGIHDTALAGIVGPIRESNLSVNAAARVAGEALPFTFTTPFWTYFCIIGGCGCTLALAFLLIKSRSKQCKYVGRLGIIPAFFGINEPIVFGLPVVLNPIFFIPFLLAPLVNAIVAFMLISSGVIGKTFAMLSWNMPNIFGVFLSTLDWKAVLFIIVFTIIDILIYLPFFKVYDKQQYLLEIEGEDSDD